MLMMITTWWQCWKLRHDDRAVTAIEYGLIAALIAAVIVVVMGSVSTGLTTAFTKIETTLTGAGG